MASVVSSRLATEAAFCSAVRPSSKTSSSNSCKNRQITGRFDLSCESSSVYGERPSEHMAMPNSYGDPVSSTVMKLIRLGRRLLPATLRPRLRALLFQWLDLTWRLPSGVTIRIASYADWIVYNQIFTSGEYDAAISRALDLAPDATSLSVVDLGANVGFFTL